MEITQKYLKELFYYNLETGDFIRKIYRGGRNGEKGAIAGHVRKIGYRTITIGKKNYLIHRLVFLYMNGELPKGEVDHINHIKDDNRWCNLRDVAHSENQKNQKLAKNNTSGMTGVYYLKHKKRNNWVAIIASNGKQIHLGAFKYKNDAVKVRKEAEKVYNFHKNHGLKKTLVL